MDPNIFPSLYEERINNAVKRSKESLTNEDDYALTIRKTILDEASKIFAERIDEMTRKRFGDTPNQEAIDREEAELKRTIRRIIVSESLDQFSDNEIHDAFIRE